MAEINKMTIETERLLLREMRQTDYADLCGILQDEKVMYAYGGAFTDAETREWFDRQTARYEENGFGLCAVILKENGEMIGQCGLTLQDWKGMTVLEIGYLFKRAYWHRGYATEAASACREYAFNTLDADEVFSIIRDTNTASRRVAERNGMTVIDKWVKRYRGIDMPHCLYSVLRI